MVCLLSDRSLQESSNCLKNNLGNGKQSNRLSTNHSGFLLISNSLCCFLLFALIVSILRKCAKALCWSFGTLFLVLCLALLLFRFAPQVYVSVVNNLTPYTISSENLQTQLLPATVKATTLLIAKNEGSGEQIELFAAGEFLARIDYPGLLSDKHNYWYLEIDQAEFDLERLTAQFSSQESSTQSSPINLHELLSALNLKVSTTKIQLSPNASLSIASLGTDIGQQAQYKAADVKQNIAMDLTLLDQGKSLNINGRLHSKAESGVSHVTVEFEQIDLSTLLTTTPNNQEQTVSDSTPIDWQWLADLQATLLNIKTGLLDLGEGQFKNLELQAKLDQSIDIQSLSSEIFWPLDDNLVLNDQLLLTGQLSPQDNGAVSVDMSSQGTDNRFLLKGIIDANQLLQSQLQIDLNATTLPLTDRKGQASILLSDHAQWLPLSSKFAISPIASKESEQNIELNIESLKAGQSQLNGQLKLLNLDAADSSHQKIEANIDAALIKYVSSEEDDTIEETDNEPLFSAEPIDWSWLSAAIIDADIKIKTLQYDERELHKVSLPITLNQSGLEVTSINAELGDGALNGSIAITPPADGDAQIKLALKASGLNLNDLKLVDESLLEGGDTLLELNLSSTGNSPQLIASNLNGQVLFELKKASVGNDAFEVIGSDLISELISKLNPFLKSDPKTELKCAIVNLDIENGLIKVDKSIAMETSKMAMVADGKINLKNETLKLKLEPQAMEGIGLDAGTLVKFLEVGGKLSDPKPIVGADGLLKSGAAVGAAIYTGGASIVLDGLLSRIAAGKACERALKK